MNTAGAVVLAIVLLLIVAGAAWVIFTRVRASRLGLPPPPLKSYIPFLGSSSSFSSSAAYGTPTPAPGGLVGWINDRIRLMRYGRNTRTAAGAYEGAGSSSSYNAGYASTTTTTTTTRGFEHLDPDDAWDSRVGGYNPYEEERELGLVGSHHPPVAAAAAGGGQLGRDERPDGEGYQMNLPIEPEEEEEERRGRTRSRSPAPAAAPTQRGKANNPFDDDAEPSNLSLRGVSPRPMDGGGRASFAARKAADGDHDRRSIFREDV
ncbi:uncharacterized protein B0T15DRAFT_493019 [Chaetomium strumarium]|uniref:Acid phosphatase-like protein n=1 Tax=Chaetomium strumarium TaxID=1170767 RepID=A0AAJ0GX96_9PEZI|nr:hypothetical protein B0T15DRAFT_493019 [Chaetomium strumarium]